MAGKQEGMSSGSEVVMHHGMPRARFWIKANLQPQSFNNIEVGASLEEDVPKGKLPSVTIKKLQVEVFKSFDLYVRKAFAKLGFKFEMGGK